MTSERVPHTGLYLLLGLWAGGIIGSAYVWSAPVACRALAASLLLFAAGRAVLPGGAVPRVRSKGFDVATYVLLSGALWYLSSWADTPLVA